MRKEARFIGKDGSCHLQRGMIYKLDIVENSIHAAHRYTVFIEGHGVGFGIPYDTMIAIRKNWKFLYE